MGTGLSRQRPAQLRTHCFELFFLLRKPNELSCSSASASPASFSLLIAAAVSAQMGPRLGGSPERSPRRQQTRSGPGRQASAPWRSGDEMLSRGWLTFFLAGAAPPPTPHPAPVIFN